MALTHDECNQSARSIPRCLRGSLWVNVESGVLEEYWDCIPLRGLKLAIYEAEPQEALHADSFDSSWEAWRTYSACLTFQSVGRIGCGLCEIGLKSKSVSRGSGLVAADPLI